MNTSTRRSGRNAFTLIELVVVIMILGILAGVAAPKLLGVSGDATDNGLKQSLSIMRDAIEIFAADNGGALPPCANLTTSFQAAVAPYVRGVFPSSPVGLMNNQVKRSAADPLVADGLVTGWMYNTTTGEFICNSTATTASTDDPPATIYGDL
jgi:general secretion pathway protein G